MNDFQVKTKILKQFRKNEGKYSSGEEISNALGVSRAYIWKYIKKLRSEGYVIDAVPNLGYRLESSPDKLYGYEIASLLTTKILGKKNIYYYDNISSTNDAAYRLAEEGEDEGAIVIAGSQSKGKGRLGRNWVSPRGGGIYMSLILRPDAETDEIQALALIVASSITHVIRDTYSLEAQIKWPNDILIDGRKVCGILTEIKAQPDRVEFLVLGIGLNVNTPQSKLPPVATSLKNESKKTVNRAELLKMILEEFEKDYLCFKKEGFKLLRKDCKKLSLILGKRVKITEHHHRIEGIAEDIDQKGALIVRTDKGERKRIFSGDVVLCR